MSDSSDIKNFEQRADQAEAALREIKEVVVGLEKQLAKDSAVKSVKVSFPSDKPPVVSSAVKAVGDFGEVKILFAPNKKAEAVETTLIPTGNIVHGDLYTARYLSNISRNTFDVKLFGEDSFERVEVDEWIDFAKEQLTKENAAERRSVATVFKTLDTHLTLRTYLVGHSLSLADIFVYNNVIQHFIAGNAINQKLLNSPQFVHLKRWVNFLDHQPELIEAGVAPKPAEAAAGASSSGGAKAKKEAAPAKGKKETSEVSEIEKLVGHIQKVPELRNAEMGKVVTRFPPEPSGYLHIGHAKAALLNHYYAKKYNGRLIIRFDDTNPVKEKVEYEENIIKDLQTMGLDTSVVSHTSDFFDQILEYGRKIIQDGNAYVDMTTSEVMRQQRMDGIESEFRSQSVEENLKLWDEMLQGSKTGAKCLLRAKIDMQSKNKCLRDPGLARCVLGVAHHRTGTKYSVYPLYDFACPIVDSLEGVTHALRSNEYHDRNYLYDWILDTLKLRKVYIEDFSRLNFSYTLLSKRKLQWFVDNKLVAGWDSPAFPTVQGMVRRGLEMEILKLFIMSMGASKASVLMDINKLWAMNRKFLDPKVPRHVAINAQVNTVLTLQNVPEKFSKSLPKHKKNADLGTKVTHFGPRVLLEREDANTIEEGEEITLMDWGNCICNKLIRNEAGQVEAIEATLHLEGDVKKTKKKLTWLIADETDSTNVTLIEFDFLITKPSLEPGVDFETCVSRNVETRTEAKGDCNLRHLHKGDKIQLERRGYFICDKAALPGDNLVLIAIPEGRMKGMSGATA